MRLKVFCIMAALAFSVYCPAQVLPAAQRSRIDLSIGGGMDYWRGDWGQIARFGPSAWATADLWHGLGINAEGHSMIIGGSRASEYKYFVGEGGLIYTYHHWRSVRPYAKAEVGFGSLSWPHKPTSTYSHDTRTTWALGGGFEYHLWKRVWARADYTYDGFPDIYSPITGHHRTLDPAGVAFGATYHFR
jgi:hypothetical protein